MAVAIAQYTCFCTRHLRSHSIIQHFDLIMEFLQKLGQASPALQQAIGTTVFQDLTKKCIENIMQVPQKWQKCATNMLKIHSVRWETFLAHNRMWGQIFEAIASMQLSVNEPPASRIHV